MKRFLFILTAVMLISIAFGACNRSSGSAATGGRTEITLVNLKVEIDESLKAYAQVYEGQTGVRVNIRTYGGDTAYEPNLQALINSGTEPEIFAFEGPTAYNNWKASGRASDLSDQAWVRDTDVAYMDGNVVGGFPLTVEGYGLGYNRALLQRAGVNPATLTNVAALRAAFESIDSQKSQLGIDAVVSMAAGPTMTWVTGLHGVNVYLTGGLPYNNPTRYIDMLLAGQVDNARLTKFAEYYNMLFQYSNRNTTLTGGYDQQLGDYALQRTVFIHQGNWLDPNFAEMGITFDMGYAPHAFLDENTDGIFVAAPSWWLVNPRAQNAEEGKKFLAAMAGTPEGHDFMVNKAGMIPAFKSIRLSPAGPFSRAVQDWMSQGKIYNWQQYKLPDGFGMDTLGPIFTEMAAGRINVQQFVTQFTTAVAGIPR